MYISVELLKHEKTHQVILALLCKDSIFSSELFGRFFSENISVDIEDKKRMFDITVKDIESDIECYIELKMFSILGKDQIEKQVNEVKENTKCFMYYILFDLSDIIYTNEKLRIISDSKNDNVFKIGCQDVIKALEKYPNDSELYGLSVLYRQSLKKIQHELVIKQGQEDTYPHYFLVERYTKIINFTKIEPKPVIDFVGNRGRNQVYVRDFWITHKVAFADDEFGIFQEIENTTLRIKADSKSNNTNKKIFKNKFVQYFKSNSDSKLKWNFESTVSIYHKLVMLEFELNDADDYNKIADILSKNHDLIKNFKIDLA